MSQTIVYVDTSAARAGRLEELKVAMEDLARFGNEPQLLAYNVYFNDGATLTPPVSVSPASTVFPARLEWRTVSACAGTAIKDRLYDVTSAAV